MTANKSETAAMIERKDRRKCYKIAGFVLLGVLVIFSGAYAIYRMSFDYSEEDEANYKIKTFLRIPSDAIQDPHYAHSLFAEYFFAFKAQPDVIDEFVLRWELKRVGTAS